MFDNTLIPLPNAQLKQHFADLLSKSGATADQKAVITKKLDKIENVLKDKIENTVTVSQYLDHLWGQPDLKPKDKEKVIKKLEAIQKTKKKQILEGKQRISSEVVNLDALNSKFQMTPFEEFNYHEKLKNVKKKTKLDMESDLFTNHAADIDILRAVNQPTSLSARRRTIHYTAGLCSPEETDKVKSMKAEEFVKKIQEEKKAFYHKMKNIEMEAENREKEEKERYQKRLNEEDERRYQEKQKRLVDHIKELKSRSEVRLQEKSKWEEEYRKYLGKRPLYKVYENNFNKAFVIPELEERKRRLKEIREFHKPIGRDELHEHEQKVLKILGERQLEKKEQLENSKWTYKKPEYESKHHQIIAEEMLRQRKQKEEEQNEKFKRREKVMELLNEVKDHYLPKVDPKKELQMIGMVDKLKKRKDGRLWTSHTEGDDDGGLKGKTLGHEYLKELKEKVQKTKGSVKPKEIQINKQGETDRISEKVDPKFAVSTKSEPIKKRNYLAELRKDHKIQTSSNVDLIIKNKNIDSKQRKELLMMEIEKLEDKAKRKEMIKKHKAKRNAEDGKDNDEDEEVDRYYISAIKAKLDLLGH